MKLKKLPATCRPVAAASRLFSYMITWPAIIKFTGDDELSFIGTQSDWDSDPDLSVFSYEVLDQLIDSEGKVYRLTHRENGLVVPMATGERIELASLTDLLRAHASQLGNCCVAKLGFYSIAEAVLAVDAFRR